MTTDSTRHIPVLLNEVLTALRAAEGGNFLDCTLGGAGHTQAILNANRENRVTAADRDVRALERARVRLSEFGERVSLNHLRFSELEDALQGQRFNGMLADLGISTDQLFEERGFSFKDQALLDMRMDETQEFSAYHLVNEISERELYVTLRQGGVGPEAKQIAHAITRARPIERTTDLAQIIAEVLKGRHREKSVHPATVTFQALRMKVNDERGQIDSLLAAAPKLVSAGGRFAVITFHSIEDKVITQQMRAWQQGQAFSSLMPGGPRPTKLGRMVEKKAVLPDASELERNPSARSARLRVFEFA